MERFHHAPLATKITALALPFAIVGAIVSVSLTMPNSLAETVTLKEYTTAPPSGSNPPPTYSSSPTYSSPSSAQPYSPPSQPPTQPQPAPQSPPPQQPPASTPPPSSPPTPPPSSPSPEPYKTPPQPKPSTNQPQAPNNPTSTYPNQPGNYTPLPQPTSGTNDRTNPAAPYTAPNNPSSPGQPQPPSQPPALTVNDPSSCIGRVLGTAVADQFRSGTFRPTNDQIAKVSGSGCFSAQISANSSANPQDGRAPATGQPLPDRPVGGGLTSDQPQPFLANIAIAPPQQFQADSPAVACAKQVLGAGFMQGTSPSPDQMVQLQAKCFPPAGTQTGFVTAGGQIGLAMMPPAGKPSGSGNPTEPAPALPPEVKACVIKAGITEADIATIQSGKSPTAQQQQLGEACFNKFAQDKGYALPTLTPPDPSQPFDPHSKQNACADLVAQTHGIHFNQINPSIVATWKTDDIGKLRSCYGVAAAASATTGGMVFAPTSPQVAVSSSKLDCIKQAIGADRLAAIMGGTASVGDADRSAVYDKCINPTKSAASSNAALLGILSAMPASDLESQFIPVNNKQLPAPTASSSPSASNSKDIEVAISGEINVPAGSILPGKVDVFVKSTPKVFTVTLNKVSSTKASWTVKIAQNKLELGNHKAYAVATLADATQVRSPETNFAVATANVTGGTSSAFMIGIAIASLAALIGAGIALQWHNRHMATHDKAHKI